MSCKNGYISIIDVVCFMALQYFLLHLLFIFHLFSVLFHFFFTESWDVYQGVVSKYFLLRGFQRLPLSYTLTNLRKNKFFKTKMRLYERRKIELNSRDRFVFDCRFVDDCLQEYCRLFAGVLQVVCKVFATFPVSMLIPLNFLSLKKKPRNRLPDNGSTANQWMDWWMMNGWTDPHIEI